MSDLAEADDIELQERAENTARSTDDLIEGQETLPTCELQG